MINTKGTEIKLRLTWVLQDAQMKEISEIF